MNKSVSEQVGVYNEKDAEGGKSKGPEQLYLLADGKNRDFFHGFCLLNNSMNAARLSVCRNKGKTRCDFRKKTDALSARLYLFLCLN